MKRTHEIKELAMLEAQHAVVLSGWVAKRRDHGGLCFLELRDASGTVQLVCPLGTAAFEQVGTVPLESCVTIAGFVRPRQPGHVTQVPLGGIEVLIEAMEVVSVCAPLPFAPGEREVSERLRYRHRFLDLRGQAVAELLQVRARVMRGMREAMWAKGFDEYQTPLMSTPSPEGARDYLVLSQKHPGKAYALPQAPQLYKQMLMVGGVERYFQIAPCFRDEDARADRLSSEFYQLDMEMSFVEEAEIFACIETVLGSVFAREGHKIGGAWPRITYAQSMEWYGTDKPDLRCGLKMREVSELFKEGLFEVFARCLEAPETMVLALPLPGASKSLCKKMDKAAKAFGLPGMGWLLKTQEGIAGPLAAMPQAQEVCAMLGLKEGDAVGFFAGPRAQVLSCAAQIRVEAGQALGLMKEGFAFAWVVDFPIFEKKEDGTYGFEHNPFSKPKGGMAALDGPPEEVLGHQYDLACNGYEVLSGALRCHDPETLLRSFEIAGYSREDVEERFGGLLRALRFGPPPHGGCAVGIERIVMLLTGERAIREVVAFPHTQGGEDVLLDGPRPL